MIKEGDEVLVRKDCIWSCAGQRGEIIKIEQRRGLDVFTFKSEIDGLEWMLEEYELEINL